MRRLARAITVVALVVLVPVATVQATPARPSDPAGDSAQMPPSGCGATLPAMPAPPDGPAAPQLVQARVGEPFTINLDSNPTTGYRWGLAQPLDESVLHLVHSAYQRGRPGLIGAGGVETWTFLPVCQGVAAIEMEYRRPWEQPAADDRHASYVVVVQ